MVQLQPLLLVADSYVVFERRRDPNASIVVAVAMPCPTRMSPQVRSGLDHNPRCRSPCPLSLSLEGPRIASSNSTTSQPFADADADTRFFGQQTLRSHNSTQHTAQGEKDSRDKRSRTNCLQSTRVQLKGKHRRQRVR